MKQGENYELELVKRQKRFTLEDVDTETTIPLNLTFIDKQEELAPAFHWLSMTTGKVGVDIETRGLDPHQHQIIMLQFGDEHTQFVVDTRVVDVTGMIKLLINKQTVLVGQNLKFEYKFFKKNYGLSLNKIEDTMIQEVCLYNGYMLRNDLKSLAKRYLNYEADKSIRMRFLEIGDEPFSKDEIIYGAYDVILPILISKIQRTKLLEREQKILLSLEHEYTKVLGDIELKGLYFDKDKWEALYHKHTILHSKSINNLNTFLKDNGISSYISRQLDMFDTTQKYTLNWGSSKQVIELFTSFNICPKEVSKTTKKLSFTVNAKVLKTSLNTMNKDVDEKYRKLIKDYLSMKELEQRITTFGIKFFKYINPVTNRLHSNYRQIVSTGRSSSSSPNLQNIPSDPEYRQCFTAPLGNKIINADFSGQENIVLANKSLDKDLLAFYEGGHSDMHSFIASKIYGTPMEDILKSIEKKDNGETLTDEDNERLKNRGIAKAAGFAINYGGDGHTISKNLGISAAAGDAVYDGYFKAFSGLKTYFDKVINNTLKMGYIHINDVTKRRLNLLKFKQMESYKNRPEKKREYLKLKGTISRLSLNAPVQGTAADITKTAAIKFRNWIIKEDLEEQVFITNLIHDEINVECDDGITAFVAPNLEKCMASAGDIWCKVVPLKAKAAIGDYWAH